MRGRHSIARSIVVAVVLLGIARVPSTEARCTFERSPKAKKLDISLVRALETCPGITHPAPNTMVGTLPACTPSVAESEYSFRAHVVRRWVLRCRRRRVRVSRDGGVPQLAARDGATRSKKISKGERTRFNPSLAGVEREAILLAKPQLTYPLAVGPQRS